MVSTVASFVETRFRKRRKSGNPAKGIDDCDGGYSGRQVGAVFFYFLKFFRQLLYCKVVAYFFCNNIKWSDYWSLLQQTNTLGKGIIHQRAAQALHTESEDLSEGLIIEADVSGTIR